MRLEKKTSENLAPARRGRVINQIRVACCLTFTLLPRPGHLTLGRTSGPVTLSSVRWVLLQHGPPSLPVLTFVPWTLLGPVEVWALLQGIQGCESVAEQVPDFLVKPLILRSACFCFFQVVVLGPLCHQLWPFPAPAAQPSSPPPSRPLTWPWTKRQDGQALVPWCCVLGGAQRDGKSLCYLSLRRVVQRSREFNLTRTIT